LSQLTRHREADVVAGALELGPGIAEADDEDAVALLAAFAAAEERQGLLALALA
jgi:hypothetical protein